MPVTGSTTFPTAQQVMDRARAIVNDTVSGGAGRILTNQAPFSVQFLDGALEELQDRIRNNGVVTLVRDNVILRNVTPVIQPNVQTQTFISAQGYYDGTTVHATPFLPGDLITLLRVWEMQTGSNFGFTEMTQATEGLPSCLQGPYLNMWEWRDNKLCMIGSTETEDLRIRYIAQLQPIGPSTDENPWTSVSIAIPASIEALATLVAYRYARARGGMATPAMQTDAMAYVKLITNRYIRQAQRVPYSRMPYGGYNSSSGDGHGGGCWDWWGGF
jgi:hypothetical protein